MKNKSEELAKILGIEPKEQIFCGICEYDEDLDESDICPHYMADECKNIEWIYPDFTKPSNFVKLIELQVSKKLIVGRYLQGSGTYGVPFSNQWYDRESFFNILIDYLSRTDKCFARNRNKIMYKAQQTEWVY